MAPRFPPSLRSVFGSPKRDVAARRILVPGHLDWTGYSSLVNTTRDALESGRHYNRIVMDLSGLRSVTPTGLAMLASVMLLLRDRGSFETGRYARPRDASMDHLLSVLGFYDAITDPRGGFDRATARMREHGGLVHATKEDQCDNVAGWLADYVCAKLTQCADLRSVLQFCLAELMNNVFNHADSELGAVACAQTLPGSGRVEVAVLDCGVGVQASLRTNPALAPLISDDTSAIKLALRCDVTSKPDSQTGVGLFFTRKIAVRTGGEFLLHSGNGRGHFVGAKFKSETTAIWHGTCASVRFGLAPVGLRDIFLTYQTPADRELEI